MMETKKHILFLCNFDEQINNIDNSILSNLWAGNWSIENAETAKQILSFLNDEDALKRNLEKESFRNEALNIAISAFLTYCNCNWDPKPEKLFLQEYFHTEWPANIDASVKLQRDSEPIYVNILLPELLYLSSHLFDALYKSDPNLVHLWWCFRSKISHQMALEDTSATIYSELEILIAKLSNESNNSVLFRENPRLKILLYSEICQAYLLYRRVQKTEEYLLKARELAGMKLELTGILGKRTRYQREALPQLALTSELSSEQERPSAEESHGDSGLPMDVELQDDVRLNRIQYNAEISQAELPSLEQTLCLIHVQYLQQAQPKDDLTTEELQPYIEAVLSQKTGPWSTRVAALLIRCKLEAGHKRTVERAMMQCETIVNDKSEVSPTSRLSYLWASGLGAAWWWRHQLADLYRSMGLLKAALEEYLRTQLWDDVIATYTALQLRHKAAEVIREQIAIKPTVKLYCLLGDATDDISCYEKAWEFSNWRSSRAQRHWGNYLFNRKQYADCIPHFEKSVDINSIQETVWLRLGYAALEVENWELSARAYRRYTYLQPNTFEAWNNLAKVYVKQGDKSRAYRALMEALKFNYDNWKLWENVVLISMDTDHLEDVIRAVHRLLDLRSKYDDVEVLTLLVTAVLHDKKDAEGNGASRLRKRVLELFGRITSTHQNKPELWQLYSDLSPTPLLRARHLLKAYRGYTQACSSGNWSNNPETCKRVMELATSILEYSLQACQESEDKDKTEANQQLSSARLTGQSVLRAAEKQHFPEYQGMLDELKKLVDCATEYIKSVL